MKAKYILYYKEVMKYITTTVAAFLTQSRGVK